MTSWILLLGREYRSNFLLLLLERTYAESTDSTSSTCLIYWDRVRRQTEERKKTTRRRLFFLSAAWKRARSTDISTYLNVATGNACAGQSNEKPVPFVTRNPTSFTDGNCGLLLDAGSKNRTRDRDTERSCVKGKL